MQSIQAKYVFMAADFIADDHLEALNCVNIEPHEKGAMVVACNGTDFVCFLDESAEIASPILIKIDKAFIKACKPVNKKGIKRIIFGEESLSVIQGSETIYVSPKNPFAKFQFPDWRRFFNFVGEDIKPFGNNILNPRSLRMFTSLSDDQGALRFFGEGGEDDRIFVKAAGIPEFIGITMPLHKNSPVNNLDFLCNDLSAWS